MKLKSSYRVKPQSQVSLKHLATDADGGFKSAEAAAPLILKHRERLSQFQEVLYAGQQNAVLIVLQGMDTAGKDGTIRHIFSGINPQGCDVTSFKVPTSLETRHDFLWRIHPAVPPRGIIGIFNRSHYEDVLSPRVHKLISPKTVAERLGQINAFEQGLHEAGVVILNSSFTSPAMSRPPAFRLASTPPTSIGSYPTPTSRSATSGRSTRQPTTTSSRRPAESTLPGL
jgi:polyphosphate kinase 2 (PPK2 family)